VVTEEKCGRCENYYFDEELGLPSCKENRDIPF
jgi:hypothetical protein